MAELHYLLMANFELLKDNVIEEVLRERAGYYLSKNKKNDFWIIHSPQFLFNKETYSNFQDTAFYKKNNKQNYFAILSSDKTFINWLGLRIGYFEPLQKTNDINSKKLINYTINGILGTSKEKNPLLSIEKENF